MQIEIVNPAAWINIAMPVLLENWAETGFEFAFAPDVEVYQKLYDAGIVFGVVALGKNDGVIGYCSVAVVPHPHNPSVLTASNDALFIVPAHRNGVLATRLIRAAEAEAAKRGAQHFSWHCRTGTALAETLQARGYKLLETIVSKRLNDGR